MVAFLTVSGVYCPFPSMPTDNGFRCVLDTAKYIWFSLSSLSAYLRWLIWMHNIIYIRENLSKYLVGQLSSNLFLMVKLSNRIGCLVHLLAKKLPTLEVDIAAGGSYK